ncbi:TLC domain-containing protein 3A isoform X3 [Clupea harengus]|uniref:TLC domain-containing protein 3A isoform X3 n=1 Tax=Clupea harengus TaxID=7950 RepID=A0A6P8FS36_CLUHA|nr:TLC domain-containing protein 3A isoform X3 [Clupea harengus]
MCCWGHLRTKLLLPPGLSTSDFRLLISQVNGCVFFPGLFFTFKHIFKTRFKNWKDADGALVSERHWLATDFVWFGAPYMAYDIYAMYQVHYLKEKDKGHAEYKGHSIHTVTKFLCKDFLFVLHHVALLTIFMPVSLFLRRGLGDFFIGCFFITELSTPFLSAGGVLIQMGLQDSTLHKINGLMLLLTFFLCRILLFPFMYWVYGRNYNVAFYKVALHLPLHCNLGNLCILAPQLYWFTLLCRKARRLFLQQHKKRDGQSPKTS